MYRMLTVKYVFVVFGYLTRMCVLFGNATGSSVCDRNGHILKCQGNIPLNVSIGITAVFLTNLPQGEALTNLTFAGFGWDGIDALNITNRELTEGTVFKLGANCFSGLTNLRYLGLQLGNIVFESDAFYGLHNLNTLDLSNWMTVSQDFLEEILKSQYLFNLNRLILPKTGIQFHGGLNLDEMFWSFVGRRQIKELDISMTYINNFNVSAFYDNCNMLVYFAAISTHIKTAHLHSYHRSNCNIERNYVKLTVENLKLWCSEHSVNDNVTFSLNQSGNIFQSAHTSNIENRCNVHKMSLNLDHLNLTDGFQFDSHTGWNLSDFSLRYNEIGILENPFICANTTMKALSMSHNKIYFVHPETFANINTLISLDISYNSLFLMNKRNRTLFGKLFSALTQLMNINMAHNTLSNIPEDVFINNKKLHAIDLSRNQITDVSFKINQLLYLKTLNLRDNYIFTLGHVSRYELNALFSNAFMNVSIELLINHLTCSSCEDYPGIIWLQKNKRFINNAYGLDCLNDNKRLIHVLNHSLDYLEGCNQLNTEPSLKPILTVIIVVAAAFGLYTFVAALKKYFVKRALRRQTKHDIVQRFVKGAVNFEYLVFLAFSSKDEEFVNKIVINPLQQCLNERVGPEHKHVLCIGDRHFRVGRYIHDEIITCLEKCKVVTILLTDDFCRSNYCMLEFQKACQLNKPVIFMIKDKVNEDLMTPTMRLLYHSNARILWTMEKEEYVLKSTWPLVCDSILDLAAKRTT